MAQLLDVPETRLLAILTGGRGADGTLGSQAQSASLAATVFRRLPQNAPAEESGVGGESVDRGLELEWADLGDTPDSDNEQNAVQSRIARCNVRVLYALGAGASGFVYAQGSEVAATVALNARKRALSDAERIRRALCFPALFQDGAGDSVSDPVIYNVTRIGRASCGVIGDERLVCVSAFDVEIQYTHLGSYNP